MFGLLLALAVAAGASAPPAASPKATPLTGSLQGLIKADDYPVEAMNRDEQGTVGVTIKVDERGAVADCVVAQSSGSPSLDSQTCRLIWMRAKFSPAKDEKGRPIPSETSAQITWLLEDDPTESDPWVSRYVIDFPKGGPPTCRLELEGAKALTATQVGECDPEPILSDLGLGHEQFVLGGIVIQERFLLGLEPVPAPPPAAITRQVLQIDVAANGKLRSCKVVEQTPDMPVDGCATVDKSYVPRKDPKGNPLPFKATIIRTLEARVGPRVA